MFELLRRHFLFINSIVYHPHHWYFIFTILMCFFILKYCKIRWIEIEVCVLEKMNSQESNIISTHFIYDNFLLFNLILISIIYVSKKLLVIPPLLTLYLSGTKIQFIWSMDNIHCPWYINVYCSVQVFAKLNID